MGKWGIWMGKTKEEGKVKKEEKKEGLFICAVIFLIFGITIGCGGYVDNNGNIVESSGEDAEQDSIFYQNKELTQFDIDVYQYFKNYKRDYADMISFRKDLPGRVILIIDEGSPITPWDILDFKINGEDGRLELEIVDKNKSGEIRLREGDILIGWVDRFYVRSGDKLPPKYIRWVSFTQKVTAVVRDESKRTLLVYAAPEDMWNVVERVALDSVVIDWGRVLEETASPQAPVFRVARVSSPLEAKSFEGQKRIFLKFENFQQCASFVLSREPYYFTLENYLTSELLSIENTDVECRYIANLLGRKKGLIRSLNKGCRIKMSYSAERNKDWRHGPVAGTVNLDKFVVQLKGKGENGNGVEFSAKLVSRNSSFNGKIECMKLAVRPSLNVSVNAKYGIGGEGITGNISGDLLGGLKYKNRQFILDNFSVGKEVSGNEGELGIELGVKVKEENKVTNAGIKKERKGLSIADFVALVDVVFPFPGIPILRGRIIFFPGIIGNLEGGFGSSFVFVRSSKETKKIYFASGGIPWGRQQIFELSCEGFESALQSGQIKTMYERAMSEGRMLRGECFKKKEDINPYLRINMMKELSVEGALVAGGGLALLVGMGDTSIGGMWVGGESFWGAGFVGKFQLSNEDSGEIEVKLGSRSIESSSGPGRPSRVSGGGGWEVLGNGFESDPTIILGVGAALGAGLIGYFNLLDWKMVTTQFWFVEGAKVGRIGRYVKDGESKWVLLKEVEDDNEWGRNKIKKVMLEVFGINGHVEDLLDVR
jgi:hypothetical protein